MIFQRCQKTLLWSKGLTENRKRKNVKQKKNVYHTHFLHNLPTGMTIFTTI